MENNIKTSLLNYAAHLSEKGNFISQPKHGKLSVGYGLKISTVLPLKSTAYTLCRRNKGGLYTQNHMCGDLAKMLCTVNKLLKNKAKVLVINNTDTKCKIKKLDKTLCSKPYDRIALSNGITNAMGNAFGHKQVTHKIQKKQDAFYNHKTQPYLLQSGWMNGACTNWSRLCKLAWNSHKLTELARRVDKHIALEGWVLDAQSIYRGLQLSLNNPQDWRLAYKYKPDCVFLINPNPTTLKECEKLHVPVCIFSTVHSLNVTGCSLESNQESCFLTYLILCVMCI